VPPLAPSLETVSPAVLRLLSVFTAEANGMAAYSASSFIGLSVRR
jgi:hypothetical protein